MMESIEFTVKVEHLSILKENFSKIQDVFHDVELKIEDSETKNTTKHDWVTVVGENKEICKKTKDYIVSLTNPEKIILKDISESFYKIVTSEESDLLKVIERETSVSLKLLCKTCLKIQSYDEVSAVIAESIIDEKNKSKSSKNNNETIEHIGVDENLQNFAFKLGYDKEDILKASKNIIQKQLKLNENTLLQELVNSCPEKLKDKVIHFENVTEKQISNMTECKNVSGLREIVIDGSNVAMCHGNKEIFSCRGIEIVVDWFLKRGHTKVFAFVPQWRLENPKPDSPILNQEILKKLERDHRLIFTPSRNINGRRVACYDDRFIVKYAYENDGIIVSNDHFRDLQKESTEWKIFLEQHLLMFAFVQNSFMPPDDPLGRSGPTLSEFLRKGSVLSKACPYRNKCTYGTKCRFYHPQSTQEKEHEKNAKRLNELLNPSENNKHKSEFDLGNNCSVISNKVRYRVDRSLHKEVVSHRQAPPLNCGLQMRMHAPSTDFELSEHDVIARGTSQRKSAVIDNDDVKGNHPHHKESFIDPRYPRHPTDYMTSYSRNDERFTSPSYTTNMQRENYNMSSTMGGGNSYMASPYEKYPPPPRYDTAPVSSLTLGASGQSFSQNPYVYNLTPALHPSYTPTQTNIPFDSMTPHNYHQHYYNQNPIPVTPFAMQRTHLLQQQITPSHTLTPLRSNMKPNIQTSIDEHLFHMLLKMFPGQQRRIQNVLYKYPGERNVDKLYHYITSQP